MRTTLPRDGANAELTETSSRISQVAGGFPSRRLRRLRRTESMRQLVRETRLDPGDFIYPLFVSETVRDPVALQAMPGQYQWPVSHLAAQAERVARLGIGGLLLFGIPAEKDELGSQAYDPDGI